LPQHRVDFRQALADGDALGALLFAFPAGRAGARPLALGHEPGVDSAGDGRVVVDDAVVVELEVPGDVDAARARPAIAALGTGDGSKRPRSAVSSKPTSERSAARRFSSTSVMAFMPLRTVETSAWSHVHCRAHSAGDQPRSDARKTSAAAFGGTARRPPRSGSMTTMPIPFAAAYFRPAVPAWFSVSI
jgi:hypothetical protein